MRKTIRKLIVIAAAAALLIISGLRFYTSLTVKEPLYPGPGVTEIKKLSEYFPGIAGTAVDTDVYILEGQEPGGTMFILGGTHPNELSGVLASTILIEKAVLKQGRLIIIPHGNQSAFTATHPGEAYPSRYTIETEGGERWFRFGDRWTNPVHQWPDPEAYTHYPSGQIQSLFDIRNLNRCFPGRPNGGLTEKLAFAITSLIREEKADVSLDMHEAEPMYPIINTIVAHERAMDVGIITAMNMSAFYDITIGNEPSPQNLHGLSHREWGDHTDTLALLAETGNPVQDPSRGRTNEALLLEGKDEFMLKASEEGLLFVPYDESGLPIEIRVGRQLTTIQEILNSYNEMLMGEPIVAENIPAYSDIVDRGVGAFLNDAP